MKGRELPAKRQFFEIFFGEVQGAVQTPSYFVETLLASWRLPPKAAVSAYGRHSFVEGIKERRP